MLRLKGDQLTIWDVALPAELRRLPEELAKVDRWLDDERFFVPYREKFNQRIGRPTVPVDTFHRLMYLRFRHQLSYEVLVREVRDSITWRQFCRIPLDARVPDSTTLVKLVKKYGPATLDRLNEELVRKAREKKVIRGRKLRVDTTVVESDINYPTDAGLLADGVRTITRVVHRLKQIGVTVSTRFRDQTHAVKRRMMAIGKVLQRRTGEAKAEVDKVTKEVLDIARRVVTGAKVVAYQATEAIDAAKADTRNAAQGLVTRLRRAIDITTTVIGQTEQVLGGNRHIPNRVVSLFDPEARPIRKGKLKSPTEFGYKVLIQETEERLVTGYQVHKGNPGDHTLLPSAIDHHEKVMGRVPQKVAGDRGFSTATNERLLKERGVKHISLPYPGKITDERRDYQRQRWFRGLQRWRAGGEGTISLLKRKYGMRRTRLRGYDGARSWVAGAIWAHNLARLATLE